MLEFLIVFGILSLLMKIKVGEQVIIKERGAYDFDSVDDAMEFRELKAAGFKGDARDFYKYKMEG